MAHAYFFTLMATPVYVGEGESSNTLLTLTDQGPDVQRDTLSTLYLSGLIRITFVLPGSVCHRPLICVIYL